MSVDHDIRPARLDQMEGLAFTGEPFDPSRWVAFTAGVETGTAPVAELPAPAARPDPAPPVAAAAARSAADDAAVREAIAATVRDIRLSVTAAHASALDAQLRLQLRTAAALLAEPSGSAPGSDRSELGPADLAALAEGAAARVFGSGHGRAGTAPPLRVGDHGQPLLRGVTGLNARGGAAGLGSLCASVGPSGWSVRQAAEQSAQVLALYLGLHLDPHLDPHVDHVRFVAGRPGPGGAPAGPALSGADDAGRPVDGYRLAVEVVALHRGPRPSLTVAAEVVVGDRIVTRIDDVTIGVAALARDEGALSR